MTGKEICEMFDISAQTLYKWRRGLTHRQYGRKYLYQPLLREHEHWNWHEGHIEYNENTIKAIKDKLASI